MPTTPRRLPSIRTLRAVFGEHAKQARAILEMTHSELEALPAGRARVQECYNPPATSDIRLTCLDALGETYGVEAFEVRDGTWCDYLNVGDPYRSTVVRLRGRYKVACWGDIVEKEGAE
jgi:hypothetical protein